MVGDYLADHRARSAWQCVACGLAFGNGVRAAAHFARDQDTIIPLCSLAAAAVVEPIGTDQLELLEHLGRVRHIGGPRVEA
ncbi:MAG: hypothetical protein HQL39_16890 [Alphaproteobacteria bacterium]|nr:hypothetical protein [Alphaproteobacteria bacterium]